MEENQKLLNEENKKRAEEIKTLALKNNFLATTDDESKTSRKDRIHKNSSLPHFHEKRENDLFTEESDSDQGSNHEGADSFAQRVPHNFETNEIPNPSQQLAFSNTQRAECIIRTVETLNGQDDIGVQDFICNVKRAVARCSQSNLLLDFIKTEKIVGNAKRAIRHCPINNFDDLFNVLRTNLHSGTSIELCRAKLENCRQSNDSVQLYIQRFRQVFNELRYAIQAEHSNSVARKITLQIEEKAFNNTKSEIP